AVPPPLAYALGRELVALINPKLEKPEKSLQLGKSELLRMDMSSASKYFGVENPIAKRNRKSGSKKRKQIEIEALRVSNG
ncbi:MAG: hypothetical protein L3J46_10520, partial [Kangiellaceae bacterium]|nr:hypothetical protein [Kangiellaceae bacterium]